MTERAAFLLAGHDLELAINSVRLAAEAAADATDQDPDTIGLALELSELHARLIGVDSAPEVKGLHDLIRGIAEKNGWVERRH